MTSHLFSLIPFSAHDAPKLTISGMVERHNNLLSVYYTLTGKLQEILLPPLVTYPARRDELWRTTCFELFLTVKYLPQYWEFNMSPSGDWNVYVMDDYRQVNMREETRIQWLQFKVQNDLQCFLLEATLDLNAIIPREKSIEAGISTVISSSDGKESYWALAHLHTSPDFHLRDSFVLELPPSK